MYHTLCMGITGLPLIVLPFTGIRFSDVKVVYISFVSANEANLFQWAYTDLFREGNIKGYHVLIIHVLIIMLS